MKALENTVQKEKNVAGKFDKNGRHFSYKVESTVGKGKIAHYEQFLLLPQCFQKTHKTRVWLGKG